MAEEYLDKALHEEFAKRIEAEEKRQNARIDKLENVMGIIQDQTVSIKTMTVSIENIVLELKKHTERLEALEAEPGRKWQRLIDGIIGAVAALIGSGLIYAIVNSVK